VFLIYVNADCRVKEVPSGLERKGVRLEVQVPKKVGLKFPFSLKQNPKKVGWCSLEKWYGAGGVV